MINIYKTTSLAIIILLCMGCANLRHKSFVTTLHVKGGRITMTDPSSEQPTPTIVFGQLTNSVMTIPYGCVVERELTTYQFWSSKPSYKEKIKIDATKGEPKVIKSLIEKFNNK